MGSEGGAEGRSQFRRWDSKGARPGREGPERLGEKGASSCWPCGALQGFTQPERKMGAGLCPAILGAGGAGPPELPSVRTVGQPWAGGNQGKSPRESWRGGERLPEELGLEEALEVRKTAGVGDGAAWERHGGWGVPEAFSFS